MDFDSGIDQMKFGDSANVTIRIETSDPSTKKSDTDVDALAIRAISDLM